MKNPTKTPWGFSQNPPPPGVFKLNSPPPWGMGVGTPWGPRGVWGCGPNPTCKWFITSLPNTAVVDIRIGPSKTKFDWSDLFIVIFDTNSFDCE